MEKLIRYADIENAVDEDLRRGHEKALELFDEYKDQITDPDKFVTLNKAPKMQELTHTVEFQPGARPHADRVIPMAPDVLPIFHEWHDRMVELGCIRKVTDEEKLQAKFLLGHLAILKRAPNHKTCTSVKVSPQTISYILFIYFYKFKLQTSHFYLHKIHK